MNITIRKAKLGDVKILAHIQTESWKSAFADIISGENMERYTDIAKAEAMYENVLKSGYAEVSILEIDGKLTKKCNLHIVSVDDKFTKLSITITEGKNRQVRRMFEAVGKEVVFLKRTKIGELGLTGLDRGKCRPLTAREIDYIRNI